MGGFLASLHRATAYLIYISEQIIRPIWDRAGAAWPFTTEHGDLTGRSII